MCLANQLAMDLAGVTAATPDPPGGEIVRLPGGEPSGVFKDNAQDLISRVIPPLSPEQEERAIRSALDYIAQFGVTTVRHMGSWNEYYSLLRAHTASKLKVRVQAAVPLSSWSRLRDYIKANGTGDDRLSVGSLKGFVDGSLGSETEPYTNDPTNRGLLVTSVEDLLRWTQSADEAGLQVCVHAIGDQANKIALDVFQEVTKRNGKRDRRFRIEHAQHILPEDFARFAEIPVIASMQPYHLIDDGRWAETVIGPERARTSYAYRSFLDNNAIVAGGSDWFVAPPIPLQGIFAAVTRATLDGANPNGWFPEQKISVEEALHMYTEAAAYASFLEDKLGKIQYGYLADFALLDRDITIIEPHEIWNATVLMTAVGGEIVFKRDLP